MYDLGIIGGGPAGYVAAERAGALGLKVVLFEKKELGGVCLNEGCIPTKTLLYSAKILDIIKDSGKYGVKSENPVVDFQAMMNRKNRVISGLRTGISSMLKKNNVAVIKENAFFKKNSGTLGISAGTEFYNCRNFLIAAGSEAAIPPVEGLAQALTNREILALEKIPEKLAIIGGGVIGMEFASLFTSLGSKVTIVEMAEEILPGLDRELALMLKKEYEKKGVVFHCSSAVKKVNNKNLLFTASGKDHTLDFDQVLVSTGRKPVLAGYGLEDTGVAVKRGILIDEKCRTNIPNIYAAGDITGFSLLAHTASREGETAVNNIYGKKDIMRYHAIPGVVYTNPEMAGAGLTEEDAKKSGIKYRVLRMPMSFSGRFKAENEGKNGLCKIIINEEFSQVAGVHMIGSACSEMIYGAALMIEHELRVNDITDIVFPHPTVSEIIRDTMFTFNHQQPV